MDLAALRGVVLEVNFSTHGVAAQVTRPAPDDTVIVTTVIWLTAGSEQLPRGAGFGRVGPTHLMAVRLDAVPTVPIGTVIMAAPRRWYGPGLEGGRDRGGARGSRAVHVIRAREYDG
jgi:hypothetical protein